MTTISGSISTIYMTHVSDESGPLFYVKTYPQAEIWLRPGATVDDVARVYNGSFLSPNTGIQS